MVSPVSGPFRGRAQGRAQGSDNGTRKQGGVYQQEQGGCTTPPSMFPPALFGLFVLDRTTRTAPAERGETGATPPFRPLARFGEGGVSHPVYHRVYHTPPPSWGSLPSSCIPAGRLPGPRAGRTTRPTERRDD